jgi:hypothetical protein
MQLQAVYQRTVDFGASKNKTFGTITLKNETYFINTGIITELDPN